MLSEQTVILYRSFREVPLPCMLLTWSERLCNTLAGLDEEAWCGLQVQEPGPCPRTGSLANLREKGQLPLVPRGNLLAGTEVTPVHLAFSTSLR